MVRSIKDRLRNAFNVSVAEVEAQDHRQLVVLGVAMVGNEARHVRTTFDEIVNGPARAPGGRIPGSRDGSYRRQNADGFCL